MSDDLLDEYNRSAKGGGAATSTAEPPAGEDLLDDYNKGAASFTLPPAVVTPPVLGRSPFGPAAPERPAPLQMPPVVVTQPKQPRPSFLDRALAAAKSFPTPDTIPAQEREIAQFGREVTPQPSEPSVLEKLTEDIGPSLRPRPPLPVRAAQAAGEAITQPVQTAASIATAPVKAGFTLGEFAGQESRRFQGDWTGERAVSPGQAGIAAGQLASMGVAGKATGWFGRRLAPAIGSRPAAIVASGAVGAGVGASFTPEDPGVGAILGGAAGAVHAGATGARAPGQRIVYDGVAESPDVRPRIGQAPEQPPPKPRVTASAIAEAPTAEPDFTVEDSPLLTQYMEQQGKPTMNRQPEAPAPTMNRQPAAEPTAPKVPVSATQPQTPFDTPKIITARLRAAELEETHAIDTPERRRLRRDVATTLYGQGAPTKNRQAYVVLGPPGAGKSSALVDPLAQQTGSLVVDPDDAKKLLPEYEAGVGAGAVHVESGAIRDQIVRKAVKNGDNVILPTLGTRIPALQATLDALEQGGYTVHVKLVDVPKEVAAQRAVERFDQGGHFVDPRYILEAGDLSRSTYEALKGRPGVQSYEKYNNNVAKGQPPQLVERIERPAAPAAGPVQQPAAPAAAAPGLGGDRRGPSRSGAEGHAGPGAPEEEVAPEPKHQYSSTQLDLPPETAAKITRLGASIPQAALAADGRETAPHITVKYGLHGDESEKVRALLADEPPVTVRLGKTSFFPNGESNAGDVLKVDVDSPALHRLNKKIADALPHTDTHPEYQPHATIAYLKPGLGKRYAGRNTLEGHTVTIDRLTFSDRNGQKTIIPLGGKAAEPVDEGLELRRKYRPDLLDEYQGRGVAGRITPDIPGLLQHESESLESEGEAAAPGPTEQDEADRHPPTPQIVVQRTIEEEGTGASGAEVQKLADVLHKHLEEGSLPQGSAALRVLAQRVLGRPYESRTWKMDDVYDALEGAANRVAREELGPATIGAHLELVEARRLETQTFKGRLRSSGMIARQQFSTPIPIARAAQIAADVQPGEKVLEPTAGTGNLVNFLRDADVKIDVNELEPRRVSVLRWLGLEPTMEDALRLPLNGKRYNAIITNPPYGSASVGGKYTGFGATPFNATDIAQRFVAAAMEQLIDGGRLVAVMPPNTIKPLSAPFRKWLETNNQFVAYIESPPGAYEGRGTNIGTVLLVVDKGRTGAGPKGVVTVRGPSWTNWEHAIGRFRHDLKRMSGRQEAVNAEPVRQEPKAAPAPKKQAELISREPAPTVEPEAPNGPVSESPHDQSPGVASGPGEASGRPGRAAPVGGVRPERPAPQPGGSGEPGPRRPASVVAEAGSGQPEPVVEPEAPGVVPEVPRGPVVTDAERARERERELTAADASPVFAPYSLGTLARRSPHPRLVVETRAMAGMPAPPITAKAQSKLLDHAWGRDGTKGGLSDEQMDAVLRAQTAWDNGHGLLASDDVGVGKTREAAGLVLEAIERGAKRILYTTKNENNVTDAMREFRLVASGAEDGDFPAEMVFVGDYKKVKTGDESLPTPDRPTIYFAHSYNFKDFAPALAEVKPTVWIADEAHEFKNQFSDRGAAWQGLHKDVLERNGHIAYFTATPAVTLDELGYLYGLREWPIGGFSDWVDRKLGHAPPLKPGEQPTGAGALKAAEASEADLRKLGERTGAFSDEASELDTAAKTGKKKFMRGRPDVFQSKVTPAETEQVMRELKGAGKYIARDLWRGGVKFDVHEVDLLGNSPKVIEQRALYDQAATLTRDISMAARKFGRMNQKVKTAGLDRALIQSYLKQLLFGLRLPTVLEQAKLALKAGDQVVISLHSVTGDADIEDGLGADDAEAPMNERLRSAINRINTEHVEKQGSGDETEYIELGEIPEALMARADLTSRLQALPPLVDPVRAIEDTFGAKNVAVITGKRTAKQRKLAMGEFQSGQRKLAVISKAGKVGISLHDVNGKRRRMLVADYEWSADTFKQELGRVDRTGQRSSPHVSLVASNLAGEKKFAATIAARMASLGATSKGSAESTGTDALDQFDVSDGVSLTAMRSAVTKMDPATRAYFTGSQFTELQKTGPESWEIIPKRTPDKAGMRDFLLELMMFPVKSADAVWKAWADERDALRTGEEVEALAARRTGRAKGSITRQTLLTAPKDPAMTLVELKNEAGEKRGVLQGFVTQYITEIQDARGLESSGATKSRRYVHVTTPDGQLVSGLELNPGEIRRVKQAFGKGERKTMTPAEAWEDLQTGDRVAVRGAGGDRWVLRMRRDGRVQIDGATIAKHRAPLQGLARFETVGNFLYVPGEAAAVTKFLERFPPMVEGSKASSEVAATGEEGTMGGTVDLHSFADPFTAALQMLKAARKLHAQRMAAQAKTAAAAAKAARPKKLTKKQRRAALQTGPTAGPFRDAIQRVFVPGARSEGAGRMSRLKAHELAKMAHENEQAIEWLEQRRDVLDRLSAHSAKGVEDYQGPRWQWAFDMQAGRPAVGDPELAKLGAVVRQLLDEARDRVQGLGTGKLTQFYVNYMPQSWKDANQAADWFRRVLGKRPLEGPKSFLRRKTIDSLEEGIDAGLIPASDNPLDLVVFKLREMNKYVTWHRIFQQGRKEGLFKFFRPRQLPQGWKWIDDNMAIVYAPKGAEGELRIRGQYAAPEPVARIVHNFLRPGLRGNPWYDSYMRLGGMLNLMQLGWSAFHLGFVAFDATISTGSAGLEELLTKGQRLRGLGHLGIAAATIGTAPLTVLPLIAPTLSYLKGRQLIAAYKLGTQDPGMQAMLDGLIAGGGRVSMDRFYRVGFVDGFRKALRDHHWVKAGLELPFAATELAMKPLLEHIVPAMKAGAFMTLWRHAAEKLPAGATQDDVDRAAKEVWDSIDNRLGQMTYDNLDWHRVTKDLLMGAIRSVGWNVGDVRELGGAAGDVARLPGRVKKGGPVLTHRMAYAIMLATLVGLYGALYTYLHTGDLPGEEDGEYRGFGLAMKDLYFPRTGDKNPDGQWERMTPPTYAKDIAGFGRHPITTVAHKVHPLLNMLYELVWSNEDFFGDQIRNTKDPWYKQAREAANYVFRTGVPFAARNYMEEKKRAAGGLSKAEGFAGFTAAPREVVRSPAENKMQDAIKARMPAGGSTPEARDASQQRAGLARAVREGQLSRREAIDSARTLGVLRTGQQAHILARMGKEEPLVRKFKMLTVDEAQDVYDAGTPEQQKQWNPYLRLKQARAHLPLTPRLR